MLSKLELERILYINGCDYKRFKRVSSDYWDVSIIK